MDLYENLTHDVYHSAIEHLFLGFGPKKIGAQKLPILDDFATQWLL